MRHIIVVDYDPDWPRLFESLRSSLVPVLAEIAISIEHVGSTAVPGLAAKPVIDIDVIVAERDVPEAVARLKTLGYDHLGDQGIPQRQAFRRPAGSPVHHLYVCPSTSMALANHLAVRDHLRKNPTDAVAYGNLKRQLAVKFAHDVDGYVEAKTAFLTAILRQNGFAADLVRQIEQANRRPTEAAQQAVEADGRTSS
jgi:GrpB-like predicted nucleotidyltransferase (UPF0157 family)